MRPLTLCQIELIPWYAVVAYWAITCVGAKRTKTAEKFSDRLTTLVPMILGFVLLFYPKSRVGFLGSGFVSPDLWIAWAAGVLLTSLGVAVTIWAGHCLGEYWSARVTLKEGHELIRSGPYRFVRHPIYTGMLLGAAGTALVVGEWRGVLAVALVLAAHCRKAVREEALLATEFGEDIVPARD